MTDPPLYSWAKPLPDMTPDEVRAALQEMADINQIVFSWIAPGEFFRKFQALFRCTRCGKCCRQDMAEPGGGAGVHLEPEELDRLASLLALAPAEFQARHCRARPDNMDYPCPFYSRGCSIYLDRPMVCRIFPLAGRDLDSGDVLLDTQVACPGGRAAMEQILLEDRVVLKEGVHGNL